MYFGDHNPPHFHVEFQGEKGTFTFDGESFLPERFPPAQPGNWYAIGLVVTDSNS